MRLLRLVIDNTRTGAQTVPVASARGQASRWHPLRLHSSKPGVGRTSVAFERILSARVSPGEPTLRELLRNANTCLARPGTDSQDRLSRHMLALMKIGLLLDVSLSPEYPAHLMVYDPADLICWLPALRAYRSELVPGTTFA